MAENREDRLLMRQRGAGTRQIKDLDFRLILPGVSGIITRPPILGPSEIFRRLGSRPINSPGKGDLAGTEASDSAKKSKQVLDEPFGCDGGEYSAIVAGQYLQNKSLKKIEKVQQPSVLRSEEEEIVIPPLDMDPKLRPTRRKRKLGGEFQRIASEAVDIIPLRRSPTMVTPIVEEKAQHQAMLKVPKKRGPRKKTPCVEGKEIDLETNTRVRKPRKTQLSKQLAQIPDTLYTLPRKRGRPKKVIPTMHQESSLEIIANSARLEEDDLEAQRPQVVGPLRPEYKLKSSSHPSQDVHLNLNASSSVTHFVGPAETSALRTQDSWQKSSNFLDQNANPPGPFNGAILGHNGRDTRSVNPPENPPSRLPDQSQKAQHHQGDQSGLPIRANGAGEIDVRKDSDQTQAPVRNTLVPSDGRLKKLSIPTGKENDHKGFAKPKESAPAKRKPLLQRSIKNPSSRRLGRPKKVVDPVFAGIEKERESERKKGLLNHSNSNPPRVVDPFRAQVGENGLDHQKQLGAIEQSQENDSGLVPREELDSQNQAPSKRRRGRRKQTVAHAELPNQAEGVMKDNNERFVPASHKPSQNSKPIGVWRLTRDRSEDRKTAADSGMGTTDQFITAVDVLAQICYDSTIQSYSSENHATRGNLHKSLKAELKRKLQIHENCNENFDKRLLQLEFTKNQTLLPTQADKAQTYEKVSCTELQVDEQKRAQAPLYKYNEETIQPTTRESKNLTNLLTSIEAAIVRGRELDLHLHSVQHPPSAPDDDDDNENSDEDMLDITKLERMLQHRQQQNKDDLRGSRDEAGRNPKEKSFNEVLKRVVLDSSSSFR